MNILLVEDMAGFALPITACLESMGHTVTWIIGATELRKKQVVGILASANADPMNDTWDGDKSRLLAVDLAGYDLALVDGGLVGPIKDGWDIVPTLVANRIVCVAISGAGGGNPSLMKSGCRLDLPKEFVVLALRRGVLDPMEALVIPESVSGELEAFTTRLRSLVSRAVARKHRIDLGYPVLNSRERGA